MFNPFDLRGPEFLVFYAILSFFVCVLLRGIQIMYELGSVPPGVGPETDPYKIARLRGHNDAIKVATISLTTRGLLEIKDDKLHLTDPDGADRLRHPLDKAILGLCATEEPVEVKRLYSDASIRHEVGKIDDALRARRFLPDWQIERFRSRTGWWALGLLWGVAITKILVALSRGHHNVAFLIIFAFVASCAVFIVGFSRNTAVGTRVLRDAQVRLAGLRDRRYARRRGKRDDIVFLAAAFGIASLPRDVADVFAPLENALVSSSSGSSSGFESDSYCLSSSGGGGCGSGGGGGCGGCG